VNIRVGNAQHTHALGTHGLSSCKASASLLSQGGPLRKQGADGEEIARAAVRTNPISSSETQSAPASSPDRRPMAAPRQNNRRSLISSCSCLCVVVVVVVIFFGFLLDLSRFGRAGGFTRVLHGVAVRIGMARDGIRALLTCSARHQRPCDRLGSKLTFQDHVVVMTMTGTVGYCVLK